MGHVGDTHSATLSSSPLLPQVTSGKATGAVTNTVLPQPPPTARCPHCNCASVSLSGVKDPPGAMRAPALPACRVVAVERKSRSSPPAASSFFSFPFSSAAGPVPSLPSPPRALPPHRTPRTHPVPASPGCKGNPGVSSSSKTPTYREHGGRGTVPTPLPCVPSPQPSATAREALSRAEGQSCPTHGAETPPFSCPAPSQQETSPGRSSEASFTPSSGTLLPPLPPRLFG